MIADPKIQLIEQPEQQYVSAAELARKAERRHALQFQHSVPRRTASMRELAIAVVASAR